MIHCNFKVVTETADPKTAAFELGIPLTPFSASITPAERRSWDAISWAVRSYRTVVLCNLNEDKAVVFHGHLYRSLQGLWSRNVDNVQSEYDSLQDFLISMKVEGGILYSLDSVTDREASDGIQ